MAMILTYMGLIRYFSTNYYYSTDLQIFDIIYLKLCFSTKDDKFPLGQIEPPTDIFLLSHWDEEADGQGIS